MDLGTDPQAAGKIPVKDIPFHVGRARTECGAAALLCEAVWKDCESREVRGAAHRVWQQAIRIGQAANALSAIPVGDALLWLPPRMSFWTRVRIFLILGFRIVTA